MRDLTRSRLADLVRPLGYGEGTVNNLFRGLHSSPSPCPESIRGMNHQRYRTVLSSLGMEPGGLGVSQVLSSKESNPVHKFLLETFDGHTVTAVLIPITGGRATLCVSSQVGCARGCTFCRTAEMGLVRNLSAGEIVHQLTIASSWAATRGLHVENVVFMGMGEPFDNFEAVFDAFSIMTDHHAFKLSRDKITFSTCGVVPGIRKLGGYGIRTNLAVSLNAPDDELRTRLMPVNERWPLGALLGALHEYPLRKGRTILVEYVLLGGVNDDSRRAERLAAILEDLPVKINLIPFNWFPGSRYVPPDASAVSEFAGILAGRGYHVTIRRRRGADIGAACGMLNPRPRPET